MNKKYKEIKNIVEMLVLSFFNIDRSDKEKADSICKTHKNQIHLCVVAILCLKAPKRQILAEQIRILNLEGKSTREIAEKLGISQSYVFSIGKLTNTY